MVCPKIRTEGGGARADQHPSHNMAGSEPGAPAVLERDLRCLNV